MPDETRECVTPKSKAFLQDIVSVYKKHGLALSHEDGHGAFIVADLDDSLIEWVMYAFDESTKKGGD